jgi:signal transduction histidine kinase
MPVTGNDELSVLAGNMNAMLERIERLVQGIRQVSDNIAHDLRTPMTRLRADVQVALQQEDPETYHAALKRVHNELEKMQNIFSSLLAISRAESGGMPVKRAVVDFSELLDELLELYEPAAEEKGLVLQGEVAKGLLVYGNRQLLAQIISNLLDNALKYVPPGGEIRLGANLQDNHIKVLVEDGGPGIPPEMRDKVFERFARLDPSRTMAGSGLGLSLVKAFVELHHGSISIVNSSLGGSAFLLDLPAA